MTALRLLLTLLLAGLAWALVATASKALAPPPPRLATLSTKHRRPGGRPSRSPPPAALRAFEPRAGPLPSSRRAPPWAAVAVLPLAVVGLPAIGIGAIAVLLGPRVHQAVDRRRRERAVAADLPEVVDLLTVAVDAGLTVRDAAAAVARRGRGPLARHLASVVADADAGRPFADALDDLPLRAGEPTRALAASLAGCVRYGTPIGPTLGALATEARDAERRRLEQAARRVPVLLLFPLVLCILPAFALLTVAPLLADALRALRL